MDRLDISLSHEMRGLDLRCTATQDNPNIVKHQRDRLQQRAGRTRELRQNERDEKSRSGGMLLERITGMVVGLLIKSGRDLIRPFARVMMKKVFFIVSTGLLTPKKSALGYGLTNTYNDQKDKVPRHQLELDRLFGRYPLVGDDHCTLAHGLTRWALKKV